MPSPRGTGGRAGLSPLELVVLGLFFLSGASALVYEVVWTRELTTVFGGSAFAIATVLAAYMAGLALGSTVFGRAIDRRGHPLTVYGLLEGGVAIWALLLPVLLGLLNHLYAGIYRSLDPGPYTLSLVRFVLSFLLLLIPTTLMGGTLPVLGKLLLRNWAGLGTRAGLLYGANTLGAVLGTAAGGFLLLPVLGLNGSTYLAAGFNVLVAASALVLARVLPYRAEVENAPEAPSGSRSGEVSVRLRRTVLIVYAASGFAALAYEVAWTKTLSMVLGTTNYAFTSMLATFLLGLALGSFLFARLADRYGRPEALLAAVQAGIPVLCLATVPVLGHLPQMFVDAFPRLQSSWFRIELYRVFLAAMTMFLPTVLMGGTFPLVTRSYVDRRQTGRSLGTLYAANTLGAILGSFLTGFVLIPWIGRQNSILAASAVNIAAALLLLGALSWRRVPRFQRAILVATLVLVIPAGWFSLRRWDPRVMASGAYVYAGEMSKYPDIETAMSGANLLFYDEGTEATVSVWQAQQMTSLRTNGKVEASSHGDMITQKLISHLPVFYHRGPVDNGLMIGLASGISVGSLLTHPFRKVETVELIPSMVEAASYFDDYNHRCLEDPRHRLILNDGRNHLLLTDEKYDVIVSEPSNPWIAGVSALFTREFFELTKEHLKPGGVVCQWVQTYQYQDSDLKTVLATFRDAYPYLHLWQGGPGDLVLVGSMEPLRLDMDALRASMDGPVGEDLAQMEILPIAQFLSYFVTDRDGISKWLGDWPGRVTDDNLYLEYAVPRHMYLPTQSSVLDLIPEYRSPLAYLTQAGPDSGLAPAIQRFREAHLLALKVKTGQVEPGSETAARILKSALDIEPREILARSIVAHDLNEDGIRELTTGSPGEAIGHFDRAARIGDRLERGIALNNLGAIAFRAGDLDSARTLWERTLKQEPRYPGALFNMAILAAREGRFQDAVPLLERALDVNPNNPSAANNLAYYLAESGGDLAEAETWARKAARDDPQPDYLDTLGFVLLKRGKWSEAESALNRALEKAPGKLVILLHLGMARAGGGSTDQARTAFNSVIQRSQDPELTRLARDELAKL